MLNEPASGAEPPQGHPVDSYFMKAAGNGTFGCRRSKSVGYYDAEVDKTFFCWNGEGMDVWVGEFDHKTGQLGEKHLVVVNHMKGTWDYHNYPVMVQAPDGRPLIFYCRHGQELYQLTGRPHSISEGFDLKTISTDLTCYPYAVVAGDDVYLFYSRNDDLSHPYRTLKYMKTGDSGKTWELPEVIVDSQKADPEHFDEVYMSDACYLEDCGTYPDRIQFTWSMWGGPKGHASQGQGAFCAYLSLDDRKIYSPAGKCMTELLCYHDMMEQCLVDLVPATDQASHSVHMVASSALPHTGEPVVLIGGYDANGQETIRCFAFNGADFNVTVVEERTLGLKDLYRDPSSGVIRMACFNGAYAVMHCFDGEAWTVESVAEVPFGGHTDKVSYLSFIERCQPQLSMMLAVIESEQRTKNYEGTWPVYLWVKE